MTSKTQTCKGRTVSDSVGIGKFPFYTVDGLSGYYYHVARRCKNLADDLCESCAEKHKRLESCSFSKDSNIKGVPHPSVLHGRVDEPIPLWSHIEGGEWFKKMVQKGYMKEKVIIDEKAVLEFVVNLKGTIPAKITQILATYPKMTKAAALRFIKLSKIVPESPMIVHPTLKEEVYDVVEVHVSKITITGKEYYYEPVKGKVYSLDFQYLGRYNRSEEMLHNEYPDSDAEPCL